MNRNLRSDIWGEICGAHFPKENLKCFQLLPVDSSLVKTIIDKIKSTLPATEKTGLISIRSITKIDHSTQENWNLIKELFRSNTASCMWLQDPSKFDTKTEYNLEEHIEAYRVKLKYELLMNLRDKLENYQKLVNEVAWHKMITWFNSGNTGSLDQYLNECLSELTEMKQEKVIKGVDLYEFVMKDKPQMEKLALHRQEKHLEFLKKFPNYSEIIESALERAYNRTELLKEVQEIQLWTKTNKGQEITLDYGSIRNLANYLNDSEIENLIEIFK